MGQGRDLRFYLYRPTCSVSRNREQERLAGERQPFTRAGWRKAWYRALKEAGIDGLRFHDLRHTHATRLLRATGNLALVKRMLGHRSIETTLRYEHSNAEDVGLVSSGLRVPKSRNHSRAAATG
jgi:integrase